MYFDVILCLSCLDFSEHFISVDFSLFSLFHFFFLFIDSMYTFI